MVLNNNYCKKHLFIRHIINILTGETVAKGKFTEGCAFCKYSNVS